MIFMRVYLVFEMVCLKLIKDGNQGVERVQRTVFMIRRMLINMIVMNCDDYHHGHDNEEAN